MSSVDTPGAADAAAHAVALGCTLRVDNDMMLDVHT